MNNSRPMGMVWLLLTFLFFNACDVRSQTTQGVFTPCPELLAQGRCVVDCPRYPFVAACPSGQVCDFAGGSCVAPTTDHILLNNPESCGEWTCFAGTHCGPLGECVLSPYATEVVCDVSRNCWGAGVRTGEVFRQGEPGVSLAVAERLPQGEVLDVLLVRRGTADELVVAVRSATGFDVVRLSEQESVTTSFAVEGILEDAVLSLDDAVWVSRVGNIRQTHLRNYLEVDLPPRVFRHRTHQIEDDARPAFFLGRAEGPQGPRSHCLVSPGVFDGLGELPSPFGEESSNVSRSPFDCDTFFFQSSVNPSEITAGETFARGQVVLRRDLETDFVEVDYQPTYFLLARGADIDWSFRGQRDEGVLWAEMPADVVSIVLDTTGLVYVSLTDGQVIRLSPDGRTQTRVLHHPGRRGLIALSRNGYLYFVAGRSDVFPAIIDRIRVEDGFY